MKCPVDGAELVMTDRRGVEIDYCPHCRGIWLDRGELDKILDRSRDEVAHQPPQMVQPLHQVVAEAPGTQQVKAEKPRKSFFIEVLDEIF